MSHEPDHRTDLFALGVVLYQMLTTRLPVQDTLWEANDRMSEGDYDPVTGVSEPVEHLVNAMMAPSPADRIGSTGEVVSRIDSILDRALSYDEESVALYVFGSFDGGRAFPLRTPETIVGRGNHRNAVTPVLNLSAVGLRREVSRTISRRHCRFFVEDGSGYLEDLGSMNGTRLNGHRLQPGDAQRLAVGDVIQVGLVPLRFLGRALE